MLTKCYHDVIQFSQKFNLLYIGPPRMLQTDLKRFRLMFLREEIRELENAINRSQQLDALIDLAYIALGTLQLHSGWSQSHNTVFPYFHQSAIIPAKGIRIYDITSVFTWLVDAYDLAYTVDLKITLLIDIAHICTIVALSAGWDFVEGWRRVHEANMSKVRAQNAGESPRGSTFDVIKPKGWQTPNLSDLVI